MSQPWRHPAQQRRVARTHRELPKQRAKPGGPATSRPAGTEGGDVPLVAHTLITNDSIADGRRGSDASPGTPSVLRGLARRLMASRPARVIGSDLLVLTAAAADVWLVTPEKAQTYSIWLSWIAVAATLLRRHLPFVSIILIIPGFLAGWAQLAAMIVLGTLAYRYRVSWQTAAGAALVWLARFVLWPWEDFLEQNWRAHVRAGIYGVIVAGMPVAIALLISVRQELSARIAQLAASRDRESRLQDETVRAAERTHWPGRCTIWCRTRSR